MLSQLLLFAIDLFLMLSLVNFARSLRPEMAAKPSDESATKNKSSKKHPTKAPPCPLCQEEHSKSTCLPPDAPPKISHKRGRPRSIDTSRHFCPNEECCYYGWLGRGNIRSNGHPNGGRNRQLECGVCKTTFTETLGTIFYRKKSPPETIWRVLTALAEGVPIKSVARIFSLSPDTVLDWLKEAAEQMDAISNYLLHDLQLTQVQVDELWALLATPQAAAVPAAPEAAPAAPEAAPATPEAAPEAAPATPEAVPAAPEAAPETSEVTPEMVSKKRWVWAGIDPVNKLLLACVVGDRSASCAQSLVHIIVSMLAPGCMPLFLSDQWSAYAQALLTHFGHWVETPRRSKYGPAPKPRLHPNPDLQYAQVVKERRGRCLVSVTCNVVYGTWDRIQAIFSYSGVGNVINTAFIERMNLTIRQHVPALGRKVTSIAKSESGLIRQLALFRTYYNFCLPHTSLRLRLAEPQPIGGMRNPKKWQARTPAMAAGVTDHVLTMQELLRVRVPPWPASAQIS